MSHEYRYRLPSDPQVVDEDAGDASNPNPQRKCYFLDPKKIIPLPFDESEYDPMQVCGFIVFISHRVCIVSSQFILLDLSAHNCSPLMST
jgi:hypothetical protein